MNQRVLPYALLVAAIVLAVAAVLVVYRGPRVGDGDEYEPRMAVNPPVPSPPDWAVADWGTFLERLHAACEQDAGSFTLRDEALETARAAFVNTAGVSDSQSLELPEMYYRVDPQRIFSLYHDLAALERGFALYQQHCAQCHGRYGRGNGPLTERWYTGNFPRNFTYGKYKNRTTHYGEVPTDSDLFRTITRGLYGTMMPSYRHLSARDRWSLVQFVKTLANFYEMNSLYNVFDPQYSESVPKPFAIEPEPTVTQASVSRGEALFREQGCVQCHQGDQPRPTGLYSGRGNLNWHDEMFRPVKHSRDITVGIFHVGAAPSDLYRFISSGSVIGPMPPFANLSSQDRWAVVHYVLSLSKPDYPQAQGSAAP